MGNLPHGMLRTKAPKLQVELSGSSCGMAVMPPQMPAGVVYALLQYSQH